MSTMTEEKSNTLTGQKRVSGDAGDENSDTKRVRRSSTHDRKILNGHIYNDPAELAKNLVFQDFQRREAGKAITCDVTTKTGGRARLRVKAASVMWDPDNGKFKVTLDREGHKQLIEGLSKIDEKVLAHVDQHKLFKKTSKAKLELMQYTAVVDKDPSLTPLLSIAIGRKYYLYGVETDPLTSTKSFPLLHADANEVIRAGMQIAVIIQPSFIWKSSSQFGLKYYLEQAVLLEDPAPPSQAIFDE